MYGRRSKCAICTKEVYATEKISADGKDYHKLCFRCTHCNCVLKLGTYAAVENKFYCKPHFKQLFALKGNYTGGFSPSVARINEPAGAPEKPSQQGPDTPADAERAASPTQTTGSHSVSLKTAGSSNDPLTPSAPLTQDSETGLSRREEPAADRRADQVRARADRETKAGLNPFRQKELELLQAEEDRRRRMLEKFSLSPTNATAEPAGTGTHTDSNTHTHTPVEMDDEPPAPAATSAITASEIASSDAEEASSDTKGAESPIAGRADPAAARAVQTPAGPTSTPPAERASRGADPPSAARLNPFKQAELERQREEENRRRALLAKFGMDGGSSASAPAAAPVATTVATTVDTPVALPDAVGSRSVKTAVPAPTATQSGSTPPSPRPAAAAIAPPSRGNLFMQMDAQRRQEEEARRRRMEERLAKMAQS